MKYTLRVSEKANVRPGTIRKDVSVIFAGFISQDVYSIAVAWNYGNQSTAYNLYLSKYDKEIDLPKGRIKIISAKSSELQFEYYE